jgi:hypothetical protein
MVEQQGTTIVQSARKLRIKLPTAKVILKNYRQKGEVLDKPSTRREKVTPEELSHHFADDLEEREEPQRQAEVQGVSVEQWQSYIIFLPNYNTTFFPVCM